jgi:hypothetical protein
MTNLERKAIYQQVLRMLDERRALPWWAWARRAALTHHMHTLADAALR